MVQLFPRAFLPCLILSGASCSKMPRLRCLPMYRPGKCAGMQLELRQSSSHSLLIPICVHCTGCFYIYLILHSVRFIVLIHILSQTYPRCMRFMRWGYHTDQTHPTRALKRNSLTIYISTSSDYSIPSFPFNPVFLYTHIYIYLIPFSSLSFFLLSRTIGFNDEVNIVQLRY